MFNIGMIGLMRQQWIQVFVDQCVDFFCFVSCGGIVILRGHISGLLISEDVAKRIRKKRADILLDQKQIMKSQLTKPFIKLVNGDDIVEGRTIAVVFGCGVLQ